MFYTLSQRDDLGTPRRYRSTTSAGVNPVYRSLIARWLFDGSPDSQYNEFYNASLVTGSLSYTPSAVLRRGRAAVFDGAPSYLSAPSAGIPLSGPISVSAWVKIAADTSNDTPYPILLLGTGSSNQADGMGPYVDPSGYFRVRMEHYSNSTTYATGVAKDADFHKYGYTYDGVGTFKYYFDGVQVGTESLTRTLGVRSIIGIGGYTAWGDSWCMTGQMADLQIHARKLSSTEMASL